MISSALGIVMGIVFLLGMMALVIVAFWGSPPEE